jgi:hypothetical protein
MTNFGQFWDDFGLISGQLLDQIWEKFLDNFLGEIGPILGRFWD